MGTRLPPNLKTWQILLFTLLSTFVQCKPPSYAHLSTLQLLRELRPIQPPHCSRALITQANSSFLHGKSTNSTRVKLGLSVGQSICFRKVDSKNSTLGDLDVMHTITLERLEQYHPITQRYRFAIPELETKCICECRADATVCQASDYSFGQCGNGRDLSGRPTACYRTFFSDQPNVGCPEGHSEEPKLCCELKFRPFQDRTFTAVKLEAPTTFAVLEYVAYLWNDKGRWEEMDKRNIRVTMDSGTQIQFLDSDRSLEMGVSSSGRSSNQLDAGMYFVENLGMGQFGQLRRQALNEITEHSFEKLGWFRISPEGTANIPGGFVLMDKIHRAKSEHCVNQRYQSILDANFYVNSEDIAFNSSYSRGLGKSGTTSVPVNQLGQNAISKTSKEQGIISDINHVSDSATQLATNSRNQDSAQNSNQDTALVTTAFSLAESLDRQLNWIKSATIFGHSERHVVVTENDGAYLEISLNSKEPNTVLDFIHNASVITDFSALILVDKLSNSMLNISVFNSTGILHGYVKHMSDEYGTTIDSFTIRVPASPDGEEKHVLIRIKPYEANTQHTVCLRPDDGDGTEICRNVASVHFDLETQTVHNQWQDTTGACEECNKFTVNGFLQSLNPVAWIKDIHSVTDGLNLAVNLGAFLICIFLIYFLLFKVVIPVINCIVAPLDCITDCFKNKKQKKRPVEKA
ncbi:unnamed protein product [Bursaphelenchus okinawaensis]|uniref:Uncharacterized protein n=1 Tax=Bursaphelenchus okinawaensis TaxID=465554 RepID=A0A811KC12_9BILA|nr:unnamed protein product [Bursaphelenchus okinawaensis]CAG9098773.1 unnamed protein product [Bursaphelenchus okinawaensis]